MPCMVVKSLRRPLLSDEAESLVEANEPRARRRTVPRILQCRRQDDALAVLVGELRQRLERLRADALLPCVVRHFDVRELERVARRHVHVEMTKAERLSRLLGPLGDFILGRRLSPIPRRLLTDAIDAHFRGIEDDDLFVDAVDTGGDDAVVSLAHEIRLHLAWRAALRHLNPALFGNVKRIGEIRRHRKHVHLAALR
jgi:hypothetical protein